MKVAGLKGLDWLWEQLKMRGAQFSATLTNEKRSDLCEEQAATSVPCQGGFALMLATLSCTAWSGRDHSWGCQASKSVAQPVGDALWFPP